jgi:hypothetical protein
LLHTNAGAFVKMSTVCSVSETCEGRCLDQNQGKQEHVGHQT